MITLCGFSVSRCPEDIGITVREVSAPAPVPNTYMRTEEATLKTKRESPHADGVGASLLDLLRVANDPRVCKISP